MNYFANKISDTKKSFLYSAKSLSTDPHFTHTTSTVRLLNMEMAGWNLVEIKVE
jgi:hypothetical protein